MEASKSTRSSSASDKSDKTGEGELPAYDEAVEQGYLGEAQDPRPNEAYTVEGVIARAQDGPPDITQEANPPEATEQKK